VPVQSKTSYGERWLFVLLIVATWCHLQCHLCTVGTLKVLKLFLGVRLILHGPFLMFHLLQPHTVFRAWTVGFLLRSEFFFRTTRWLEYLFFLSSKARNIFPEFNIRLYDKNSESDYYFFPPPKSEYFVQHAFTNV
jgi:hypothetical protein